MDSCGSPGDPPRLAMVEHYTASGWLAVGDTDDALIDLVAQGAVEGRLEPLPDATEYRVLSDADRRFELWLFAAHEQVRGAVPFLRSTVRWNVTVTKLLPRITGGMGAIEVRRDLDPERTLCVELPDYSRLEVDAGGTCEADVTGLAYLCRTVPAAEEGLCVPRLYPFGILGDPAVSAGEGSRCDIIACGRVVAAERIVNQVTGLPVWLIELDVDGVSLAVSCAPGMLEGEEPAPGRLFEGVFWLVGRVVPKNENGGGRLGRSFGRLRRP